MNLKETTGAQLIVMGITGGNAVKEVFVGSNSVKLARKSPIPASINCSN